MHWPLKKCFPETTELYWAYCQQLIAVKYICKKTHLDPIQGSECASETTSLQKKSREQHSRFNCLLITNWKKLKILKQEIKTFFREFIFCKYFSDDYEYERESNSIQQWPHRRKLNVWKKFRTDFLDTVLKA